MTELFHAQIACMIPLHRAWLMTRHNMHFQMLFKASVLLAIVASKWIFLFWIGFIMHPLMSLLILIYRWIFLNIHCNLMVTKMTNILIYKLTITSTYTCIMKLISLKLTSTSFQRRVVLCSKSSTMTYDS